VTTSELADELQAALGADVRLTRELPGGGMSRVFLARETALKRDVVVKVLPPELLTARSLERFRREIELTAQLQHPHILPVLSAGGAGRLTYYITPYVRGESLRSRLAAGSLGLDDALRLTRELLGAVRYAHGHRVVHRDIKPGNVLLSEGHAILADFGIARALADPDGGHPELSGSGATGTAAYLAPERPRDATADLYAIAALLREMIAGAPRSARRDAILGVIARATDPDPAVRPATAEALLRDLEHEGGRRRVRAPLLTGAFGLGLALAALVAWSTLHRPPRASPPEAMTPDPGRVSVHVVPPTLAAPAPPRPRASTPAVDSVALYFARGRSDLALPALRRRTARHPTDAGAWRDLALALTWLGDPRTAEERRAAIGHLVGLRKRLDPHDAAIADALAAQLQGDYPAACAAYAAARDARASFAAWLGLGDCRLADSLVVTDSGGPRFRADANAAIAAYVEAWRLGGGLGPTLLLARLKRLLPVEAGAMRRGVTASGAAYFGLPILVGDSLGQSLSPAGPIRLTPELLAANAAARGWARALLRPLLVRWAARDSTDAEPHLALAELLEADGQLREMGLDQASALSEIRRGVAFTSAPEVRLQAVRDEIRILLRAHEWTEASRLSDSLLQAYPAPDLVASDFLLPLAAATGRLGRAAVLARQGAALPGHQIRGADGVPLSIPPAVEAERLRYGIRAAAGVCDDEVRQAPAHLMDALDAVAPPATRPRGVEAAYIERAIALAIDCADPAWPALLAHPLLPPLQASRAATTGDTARARGLLAALARAHRSGAPSAPTPDVFLAEALASLRLGDTATTREVLALGLDALPVMPPQFLRNELSAAALPRAMALRALLDAAAGDRTSAREWASGALALWRTADPELGPAVEALRQVAAD
jgi:serine/threonine-protein kinase